MDNAQIASNHENLFPQTEKFFKNLVDNMEVGVIVSDHEGRIIYINETYARFLNMDPEAQIGKHATKIGVNSRLHIVAKTGKAEINWPHQFKEKAFLVHRVPIKENGKVIAVLGLVLFDSATTASKLAEQVSLLESKVKLYENELAYLRSARFTDSIVGVSKAMLDAKQKVIKATTNQYPVFITGESGVGKELIAQAIHYGSSRRHHPFVRVNCPAIPKELFESELFGYEKGSFTGAGNKGKPGKFELANHGTIFLDEIGDLPIEMQPKLLRVLEGKEFERVGGTSLIRSDFRLLTATNQMLEEMMEKNSFRKDLFYRLNVIPIHIPPLRERPDDIIPLAYHLLKQIARDTGFYEIKLDPEAEKVLVHYDWPGNVRELSNLLERVASYLERDTIYLCDLPFHVYKSRKTSLKSNRTSLRQVQGSAEERAILYALESTNYNKAKAADLLGIHRSLLYKKMKKYNLPLKKE
ncbi:MAG: sigma 54-interacting transcriptional regulator [Deltaproteobacteria bacterium]|nr:sigma 54-interacting transcriptional regulator [Deltaproteobacteria bacterium]